MSNNNIVTIKPGSLPASPDTATGFHAYRQLADILDDLRSHLPLAARRMGGHNHAARPPDANRAWGLAEFERHLIAARTSEGRKRARDRGKLFGRPPKLTAHQRQEAIARRDAGDETLTDIAAITSATRR